MTQTIDWELEGQPLGKNEDGKNESGIIIYLVSSMGRHELGRVGRVRQNTLNPHVSYEHQVDRVVEDAIKTLETCKKLTALSGQLQ